MNSSSTKPVQFLKKYLHLITIIIVSILPFLIIFFSPLLPHTSDGGVHLPRLAAFVKALRDGHIPVRWAGDINYGYGLPLFNFIYHVPYYVGSLFVFMGLSLVTSFKFILLISFLLSGVGSYLYAREAFNSKKIGLLVSIFYQFAPFRLVETLIRGSIGGLYAYAFFPFVLYFLHKYIRTKNKQHLLYASFCTALLVLSHNSLSLLFFGLIVLYVLFIKKLRTHCLLILPALILGLGLSAYFWIPALLEHKYTYGDLFMQDLYTTHFPSIFHFFIPNPFYASSFLTHEIPVQLGAFHVVALILGVMYVRNGRETNSSYKSIILFATIVTVVTFFFMQPVSLFMWQNIKLLRQFQFPWRFLSVTTFTTALLSLSFVKTKLFTNNTLYYILLALVIISTAYYWYPVQGFDTVNEQDYWNYPLNTTYFGETDVIWSEGQAKEYPEDRIDIIAGEGTITDIEQNTIKHTFTVRADENVRVVDKTTYFPGWRVFVSGRKVPIEFQDQNWRGQITFDVPQGTHTVVVAFGESKLRIVANIISIVSLVLFLLLFIKTRRESLTKT